MKIDIDVIIEGAIAGLAAGLMVSIVMSIRQFLRKKEQIRYIRNRFDSGFASIRNMSDITLPEGGEKISKERARFVIMKGMIKEIEQIISTRTDMIGYKEKYDLEDALMKCKVIVEILDQENRFPLDMGIYDEMLNKFKDLKWLKLR